MKRNRDIEDYALWIILALFLVGWALGFNSLEVLQMFDPYQ